MDSIVIPHDRSISIHTIPLLDRDFRDGFGESFLERNCEKKKERTIRGGIGKVEVGIVESEI